MSSPIGWLLHWQSRMVAHLGQSLGLESLVDQKRWRQGVALVLELADGRKYAQIRPVSAVVVAAVVAVVLEVEVEQPETVPGAEQQ